MPPCAFPAGTHSGVPWVCTSICLTDGDVVASRVAMAAVPTRIPSTGISGKPNFSAQRPLRYSAACSGVPMPPPTHTVMLERERSSE
ncbi:Uncharacterised protein [Mycobacteroides abscessus subsp. abscessus]|nr:Uncharacterised protein [Mycobacteroides abscessus subsp. abscessus]